MAHHKRKKPRRSVRCTLCTDARAGNSKPGKVMGRMPKRALKNHDSSWKQEAEKARDRDD